MISIGNGKFTHKGANSTPLPFNEASENDFNIELFDTKQADNFPQIKLSRFDNTYNFSARLEGGAVSNAALNNGKVKASINNYDVEFYELPDISGFEFGIHINSGILPSELIFTLQHKNITAFYQPALTDEEIAEGSYRPDDIIGSYAIYGSDHSPFKNRKITHIFRPWIEDTNGYREWCDLNIDLATNQMIISIPQIFRDTAILPVFVDPTFGYSTAPATQQDASIGTYAYANLANTHIASTGDQVDSVSLYCKTDTGTESPQGGVYDVIAGFSTNLLTSGVITATTTEQWQTVSGLAAAMVNTTEYSAAFWNTGNANFKYYWDAGAAGNTEYDFQATPLVDPFVQDATIARLYGIYASYSTAGGVTIVPMRRRQMMRNSQ